MNVAYVTNAWGNVTGHPGGVCSIKDSFYVSTGDNETAFCDIAQAGFDKIEIFDGNLMVYNKDSSVFTATLKKYKLTLSGVYTAANFVFEEIWEEERSKIESVLALAKACGAKHITVGGGAVRTKGRLETDFTALAKGLDIVSDLCKAHGLIASYHPHLGSLVETSEQIDCVMSQTKMNLCPDLAHIAGAGSDPVQVVEKYIDRIVHVHLKDYGDNTFCGLGDGEINITKVIEIAKAAPHTVDFTVEADGVLGNPLDVAKKAHSFLKNLL